MRVARAQPHWSWVGWFRPPPPEKVCLWREWQQLVLGRQAFHNCPCTTHAERACVEYCQEVKHKQLRVQKCQSESEAESVEEEDSAAPRATPLATSSRSLSTTHSNGSLATAPGTCNTTQREKHKACESCWRLFTLKATDCELRELE